MTYRYAPNPPVGVRQRCPHPGCGGSVIATRTEDGIVAKCVTCSRVMQPPPVPLPYVGGHEPQTGASGIDYQRARKAG